MKKRILCLILSILGMLITIHLSIEPLYIPTALVSKPKQLHLPRFIAHKALVSKEYEGNTLEAIQESLSSYVDGIEIDVRLSKDNIPFLYHADNLEDLTNGKGSPESFTWDELRKLSYSKFNNTRLINLEEAFKLVGSQKFLFLDIKSHKVFNNNLVNSLVELISKYNLHDTVIIESFNPIFLANLRLKARDVHTMYNFATNTVAIGEEIETQLNRISWYLKVPFIQKQIRRVVRPDFLGIRWNTDKKILTNLANKGYPIICWTIDDSEIVKELFNLGVVGVESNDPIRLMQNLKDYTSLKIYDAGGSASKVRRVIHVKTYKDIVSAINEASSKGVAVTIAGRRHSMGGQTLLDNSIHLNMLGLNDVKYNSKTQTITVEAGATWKKVQRILDSIGRSVKVMQSDNIFSVGGSLSVNVHGWQVGAPPISSTVNAIKVVTADGKVRRLSNKEDPELFKAIIGGYGQLAVIIEVELFTVPNSMLKFHSVFIKPEEFTSKYYEKVSLNSKVELAYGRLSVDKNNLFNEAGIFWYEREGNMKSTSMVPEALIAIKRAIFRTSEYTNFGKKIRWVAEKHYAHKMQSQPPLSRNTIMNSDTHILWPLYGKNKDILQEYFIPQEKVQDFLLELKRLILKQEINVLNVTIREVKKDMVSVLKYAPTDMFGFVILLAQEDNLKAEENMINFTQKLIDKVINLNGTFYLPYRLHYRNDQLINCYPNLNEWLKIKKRWDPSTIFNSKFLEYAISELN